eukprot:3275953-Prymnesium_polylepis.1
MRLIGMAWRGPQFVPSAHPTCVDSARRRGCSGQLGVGHLPADCGRWCSPWEVPECAPQPYVSPQPHAWPHPVQATHAVAVARSRVSIIVNTV